MGKVLLILTILLTSAALAQQKYYTFSELKGMEDHAGNTHLFYRLYYSYSKENYLDTHSNDIYHLDLSNNIDTLFLNSGVVYNISNPNINDAHGNDIYDIEFYHNDPSEYIYCGVWIYDFEAGSFVARFDEDAEHYSIFYSAAIGNKIGLSRQDDSLAYLNIGELVKSTNGGRTWDSLNAQFNFVSLSPFNDQILFGSESNKKLYISTNGGNNFSLVDTLEADYMQFLYDKDKNHIYGIANSRGENFLSVSNNKGDANSWNKTFNDTNKFYISLDDSVSGSIYLADRNNIYYSSNYGNNFSLFKKLDHDIVGIYKKPNSNKLYAATKYKLLEINGDSVKTLKNLPIDPKVFSYYPLKIGDKWIYNYVNHDCNDISSPCQVDSSIVTRKVVGDTAMNNGNKYYIIKDSYLGTSYERIDTTTGKIFGYKSDSTLADSEYVVDDLLAEVGDTVVTNYNRFGYSGDIICQKEENITLFDSTYTSKSYNTGILLLHTYSLTQGFGFSSDLYEYDDGYGSETLRGAVINGVVYGDTTITAINNQKNIPIKFSLSQNYPNPFNPTTTIRYSIPSMVDANSLPTGRQVSSTTIVELKVYDILGRVVATLVNKEQRAGNYEVQFNASNLASGIYFYRLTYGSLNLVRKMILLK